MSFLNIAPRSSNFSFTYHPATKPIMNPIVKNILPLLITVLQLEQVVLTKAPKRIRLPPLRHQSILFCFLINLSFESPYFPHCLQPQSGQSRHSVQERLQCCSQPQSSQMCFIIPIFTLVDVFEFMPYYINVRI